MITPTQLTIINSLLESSPDSITAIEADCIRSILSDLTVLDVENARLWNEIDGWKIRYNETSRIIGNLRCENEGATLALSEIENIGQLIGCNHTEGLSKCVREKIEAIEVENARLREALKWYYQKHEDGVDIFSDYDESAAALGRTRAALMK